MKTTKNIGVVVSSFTPAAKTERLSFSQHLVAPGGAVLAGPFWSYSEAETAWRNAGDRANKIMRTDDL